MRQRARFSPKRAAMSTDGIFCLPDKHLHPLTRGKRRERLKLAMFALDRQYLSFLVVLQTSQMVECLRWNSTMALNIKDKETEKLAAESHR